MKILLIVFTALVSLFLIGPRTSAFDLFNNCVKEKDGTQVCGPCATNKNAPTCSQATSEGGSSSNRITGANNIIKIAADVLAVITGLAAVIMIIVSGLSLATSGGKTEEVAKSRQRLVAALVGLVIVALAWTIISFITSRFIL